VRDVKQANTKEAHTEGGTSMSMRFLLLIIVIVLLIAALPTWPYSAGWGYYPGGILLLRTLTAKGLLVLC
jgi:hypothetical protein